MHGNEGQRLWKVLQGKKARRNILCLGGIAELPEQFAQKARVARACSPNGDLIFHSGARYFSIPDSGFL